MGSLFGRWRGEVCRSEDVVLEESSHMYGCALELNMNSFIRAKQRGHAKSRHKLACAHTVTRLAVCFVSLQL